MRVPTAREYVGPTPQEAVVFERYTGRARRALFFARWEVSELGGMALEPEHILLGLLREGKGGLTSDLFAHAQLGVDSVRSQMQTRLPAVEKVPISVELPFSQSTRRLLCSAAAESERFGHNHIGAEHLLLGILCEPDTVAAQILVAKGIDLEIVRQEIARLTSPRKCAE